MIAPLAIVAASYLVGSIPAGFVVGKLFFGVDVRRYGSGNIGATNVLRTFGIGTAAAVFAIDVAKGALPVAIVGWLSGEPWWQMAAALAAVVGHNWGVFLRFRGGRGVSTAMGGLLAMTPQLALPPLAIGLAIIGVSRYASLGSLIGAALALTIIAVAVALGSEPLAYLVYAAPAVALIFVQHRDNIERLLAGKERKLGGPAEPREPG